MTHGHLYAIKAASVSCHGFAADTARLEFRHRLAVCPTRGGRRRHCLRVVALALRHAKADGDISAARQANLIHLGGAEMPARWLAAGAEAAT